MNYEYELMVVLGEDKPETERNKTIEEIEKIIESAKGEVANTKDLGKRELSYSIGKNESAFYTLIIFKADPKVPKILNAKINLMENPLRHLIVRKEIGRRIKK